MIVSASRRCDLPAFQGERFMAALGAGACEVSHPFRRGRFQRVSLKREDVDAFVFWSRDPRPFLRHLPEIEARGYPSVFLITLTGYPHVLEPAAPFQDEALLSFKELARRIGRQRVIWRYDPVIFTAGMDIRFHGENFARLAGLLAPHAFRAIVSFFDPYPKALRRLRRAGLDADAAVATREQQAGLLAQFAGSAVREGLAIQSCAEIPLAGTGVAAGGCIDVELLNGLFGLSLPRRKDPAQRPLCLCQKSVDIGAYGPCPHGCLYCYAC